MNNIASIIAAILVVSMAVVYAGNDSRRVAKYLSKNHTFRKLSNDSIAVIVALLIYLPPPWFVFLPSIIFRMDSEILLCSGAILGALWILVGYLLTGAKGVSEL
ncbi:MAG: hypothetical protein IPJ90_00170 [Anaerolineaceae bacterium]|nr:hypothetical protein [Anaerolineaceae bacterium]